MGTIRYSTMLVDFDDRLLAHLQIVIIRKLRRNEAFAMSWLDSMAVGDGRTSAWITPGAAIVFKFNGSRVPEISTEWLDTLSASAASARGLVVTEESGKLARALNGTSRTVG